MKMTSATRAIDKIYKRRDRYEIPDWQRQNVWGLAKKQKLIDSILKGWKLPKFYLLKTSSNPEEYDVVDGQQRLLSIFDFFGDALPLSEESAKAFGAQYYSQLPDAVSDAFDDYEIEYDEIEDASDEEIKEFFQRLQEGLPLTSSEKLNSVHSKLRDYVAKLAKHRFFKAIDASDKRYGHFDIMAKAAAIEVEGIDVGLRYDDLHAVFQSQAQFSDKSNIAKRLDQALNFLADAFPAKTGLLRNRTMVQSLISLTARLVQSGKAKGKENRLAEFFAAFAKDLAKQVELGQQATETDLIEFQNTVNANVKTGARTRQEVLVRRLLAFDPSFADVFDAADVAEFGMAKAVASRATELAELVGAVNEKHSAEKGEDLFKATNKTALAQARLAKPLKDFEDYKSFVDDLYFLFYEGAGSRFGEALPASIADVKALRTALRHDVDHGKPSKVRSKKIGMGDVFKKYSGEPSPEAIAPERFVVVQGNLLAALKRDLQGLK